MKRIIYILLLVLVLFGCQKEIELDHINKSFVAMNTIISYQVYAQKDINTNEIIEKTVQNVEKLMSRTDPESEIYKVNNLAALNQEFVISDSVANVIELALEYQNTTNNLFRITILPLVELWDVMNPDAPIPTEEQIRKAIELSHVENMIYNDTKKSVMLTKDGSGIDLGGIAKGYAADLVQRSLKEKGVKHGFISLGGGVQAFGGKPNGDPWVLGLQNPIEPERGYFARYEVFDGAVVTSGDYQRYKVVDDVVYHHIIDPRTGYPVQKGIAAVTVFSNDSITADAYSTAFYIMGFEDSLEFIKDLENIEVMFVFHDKSVYLTDGLKDKVQIVDQEFFLDETGR